MTQYPMVTAHLLIDGLEMEQKDCPYGVGTSFRIKKTGTAEVEIRNAKGIPIQILGPFLVAIGDTINTNRPGKNKHA